MSNEREDRIERITAAAGRAHVVSYSDGSVEVTIPGGACWLVSPAGHLTIRPFNHSVNWSYDD